MIVEINGLRFLDVDKALNELVFSHYPLMVSVNGVQKEYTQFSDVKRDILNQK